MTSSNAKTGGRGVAVIAAIFALLIVVGITVRACKPDHPANNPAQAAPAQQQASAAPTAAGASASAEVTVAPAAVEVAVVHCADASETVVNYCPANDKGSPGFTGEVAGDHVCTTVVVGADQPTSLEVWEDGKYVEEAMVSADKVQSGQPISNEVNQWRFVGHMGDDKPITGYWLTKPGQPCVRPTVDAS